MPLREDAAALNILYGTYLGYETATGRLATSTR